MAREGVKLGLIGLGTVGSGVVQLLDRQREAFARKNRRPPATRPRGKSEHRHKTAPASARCPLVGRPVERRA